MHLSVFMGPLSPSPSTDHAMIDMCLDHARLAAQAGFAMVTFGEQHFNGYEPYCNPFMMGARLAGDLGQTWFGVTACPFVLRTPLRLVEDINLLDVLTGGRVLVGLSGGRPGFTRDFEAFGLDPAHRDSLYAEKLDVMLRAWAHTPGDPPLTFAIGDERGEMTGRLMPVSVRRPHPQIALATSTDLTIEDAGRRGVPVLLGPMPRQEAARRLALHSQTLANTGHDYDVQIDCAAKSGCLLHVVLGQTEDDAWARAEAMNIANVMIDRRDSRSLRALAQVDLRTQAGRNDPYPRNVAAVQSGMVVGTADQVAQALRDYASAGVQNLITRFTFGRPTAR
jgi:alkanesulfonate monooxygenase SsuD/methylene tetrahydromethanopterin reductase-like flavin-dependent oxidoreductase (luciferase family)